MGFYNDMIAAGNTSGVHTFDAAMIDPTLLAGASIINVRQHLDGELVDVTAGGGFRLNDVLIHFNGRVGARDLTKDTIVLTTQQLASLSNQRQNYAYNFEQTPQPNGRRPGSTRPPRETAVDNG